MKVPFVTTVEKFNQSTLGSLAIFTSFVILLIVGHDTTSIRNRTLDKHYMEYKWITSSFLFKHQLYFPQNC